MAGKKLAHFGLSFICVLFISLAFGFKAGTIRNMADVPRIEIWLDSIPPGPITVKQLSAVKRVRVTTAGEGGKTIEHKIKTCVLQCYSLKGLGGPDNIIIRDTFVYDMFRLPLSYCCNRAKPGYSISLAPLDVEGMPKYKCVVYPNWGVVAEKK